MFYQNLTLLERFKVAFSLVERASTGTLSGSEMAGALNPGASSLC